MLLYLIACMAHTQSAPSTLQSVDALALSALLQNPGTQPLVLSFWATWCGPCVQELPVLEAVARKHPELQWKLVNVDGAGLPVVQHFLSQHAITLQSYVLENTNIDATLQKVVPYWPEGIPFTLVIQPGGEIYRHYTGAFDATLLEAEIQALTTSRW